MTTTIGAVPELLERVAAPDPAAPDQNLTSFIRLSLDDTATAHLLQHAAAQLAAGWPTDVTATTILDETMALTGADLGNVQLADPTAHTLRIIASAGFGQDFLDHFAVVGDETSACGRALDEHRQTVISDVETDDGFTPHRAIAAAARFRSVQSTPLIDIDGDLVGVVSTHFPRPGAPTARTLEVTRLYGLVAGEALARSLNNGRTSRLDDHHGADPISDDSLSAPPQTTVLDLTDTIVRALLSAGLSLAGAQSLIGDCAASDRVAEAIDKLDQALDGIRSAVLDLHS